MGSSEMQMQQQHQQQQQQRQSLHAQTQLDHLHQLYRESPKPQTHLDDQPSPTPLAVSQSRERKNSTDDDLKQFRKSPLEEERQAYSLSWKEFSSNFVSFFKELQEEEELVDVTLACEGRQVSAHKVVLAASSPFFRRLLKSNPCQHPIVILNEVRYSELAPLLHYMYYGEVHIHYDQITDFLRTARLLQVRGLTGEGSDASPPPPAPPKEDKPPEDKKTAPQMTPPPSADDIAGSQAPPGSPPPKRLRISHSVGSLTGSISGSSRGSPVSPVPRADSSPPEIGPPPLTSLPGSMPPLPPIPGLSLPLSIPSTIASLPPVTSALPPGMPHLGHHQALSSAPPFPHLFSQSHPLPPSACEDNVSDTCASDRSEERNRTELENEEEHENSLEKMSGLANMAALKGLAGFPGPSGLVGLSSSGMMPNSDHSPGRPRFDFYRVRATDPRPCHLCGKIYKNAHTLRTHMEDKHSNCNGFRCVLCGTVAKSRNSLHSHMSRQHRGISTKDLPLLPMPAPWNPEMASKYIQLVGGVGEVVRQNYRRPERDGSANSREGSRELNRDGILGSDASTPTSQENGGTLSPYLKSDLDKDRRSYDSFAHQLELSGYGTKPPAPSILDAYLQMMRVSGVDLMHGMQEKAWEELRHNAGGGGRAVLDLTRTMDSPHKYDDDDQRGSDHYTDDESVVVGNNRCEKPNGRDRPPPVAPAANKRAAEPTETEEEAKWAVQ